MGFCFYYVIWVVLLKILLIISLIELHPKALPLLLGKQDSDRIRIFKLTQFES